MNRKLHKSDHAKEASVSVNGRQYSVLVYGTSGSVVFCLHGFPDHNGTFHYQAKALADLGFQVVCPCMPGYERSSIKLGQRYDSDYLSAEILALISAWTSAKVHLIGHDWGAVVAYASVVKAPQRFSSLSALTIPYNMTFATVPIRSPKQLVYSWYMALFQLPEMAEWALESNNFSLIDRLYRQWSPGWTVPLEHVDKVKAMLAEPLVKRAVLGYYRALTSRSTAKYMTGQIKVPTLLLRGATDGCIAAASWDVVNPAYFEQSLKICSVDAGHFLHLEQPAQVNALLIEHLKNNDT